MNVVARDVIGKSGVTAGPVMTADLAEIYRRRYARYLRVAEAIVGDRESAREVVQDAFVRLMRTRSGFRGEGSLDGWVWTTILNTASNTRRDRALERTTDQPPTLLQSHTHSTSGDTADLGVRALIARLPEQQRLVLFLRYYADLDYRSIAEVLNVRTGTIGATLNQAHAAMRRLFEEVSS